MRKNETREERAARLKQLKSEFGKRLRNLRRARDITQNELAEMLDVQGAAVGKYESQNNYPGVFGLIQLSEVLDVSIDYLLLGKERTGADNAPMATNNNSFVQSNIQANNGGVVVNGHMVSPEALELLRIYDKLEVRGRFELLRVAFDLEKRADEDV